MTMTVTASQSGEASTLQTVQQHWNSGNQPAALEALRPSADADRPWAVGLMCWLTMQQGLPAMHAGLPYARRAAALGLPWAATNFWNTMLGNINNAPQYLDDALSLAGLITPPPFATGIDPIGQGWNLLSQGRPEEALRLMGLTYRFPVDPDAWSSVLLTANEKLIALDGIVTSARQIEENVKKDAILGIEFIRNERDAIETSARQANLLVSSIVSDATNTRFEEDAVRNETESRNAWRWGLAVLGTAAAIAVMPLILHYLGVGPEFNTSTLLGAHLASTLALATIAGVLLSRARLRDQATQHARDLSTAMTTMIAYSNQIANIDEKQRFITTMGQLILQSHLTSGSSKQLSDESLAGFLALANTMRNPPII